MNYALHPDALGDLRDTAAFYLEQAGTSLSQSFLGEFQQSINKLLLHPALGFCVARKGRTQVSNEALPVVVGLYSIG
jgi:plasmid stabilization system protein ParE